jgi:hypothetical protein
MDDAVHSIYGVALARSSDLFMYQDMVIDFWVALWLFQLGIFERWRF